MRIGYGYDAHRFKEGRDCIICGVKVPSDVGPDGHSDADVAVHALMDALLGAAALGDIGKLFPDTDDRWLGADSIELLKHVIKLIRENGYEFVNADITVVAQKPKLAPYIQQMRNRLADAMETDVKNISVKATTEEKMGFTGDCTGIAAHAAVLIQ
ncbi:MAG: 2-C-methyl-D-erythritol 2,4-cyclodiphosphate synthase [Oscillospiraceae bacterium]|nr:2-C-methyl-D-erythritol 2,4-cyclodiphosphate synthase [Oscillospiraceae bacterium]